MLNALREDLKELRAIWRKDAAAGYPFAWVCRITGRHRGYRDIWKGDHRKFGCSRCGVETMTAHGVIEGAKGRVLGR